MEYFSKGDVLSLLIRNSITKKITLADGVSIYDSVKNLPTADVVPKSEVEKFVEEIKLEFYREFDEIIPSIMADKIDELKKKYTEEQ